MADLSAVTEWETAFCDYLNGERRASPLTVCRYRHDVRQFGLFLSATDAGLQWSDADTDLVRDWVVQMMDEGFSASSVNTCLSSIRSFYRFLLQTGRIEANRVRLVRGPKKDKPLPAFVRESEMNRLLDIMSHNEGDFDSVRDRLIVLMLYLTGIRRGELLGLRVGDVDLAQCQLRVVGKRSKQRLLPFGDELKNALADYLKVRDGVAGADSDRLLFITKKGAPMTPNAVTSMVKDALALVTTSPRKSPHVLRHTFATTMLNGGADLESVKELLGHESVATTEIYTHATFEHLRQVYQNSHPRA